MNTVCSQNQCVGCMACIDLCPRQAISIKDNGFAYNAVIDNTKCIHCNVCNKSCQNNKKQDLVHPISWYQGWINDVNLRNRSSSGGAAIALSLQFIKEGGVVISCCFDRGRFIFDIAEVPEELYKFTGSKYVKSNPTGVYKRIKSLLELERKVLFIGLPCQVGAIKTIFGQSENLYTVDLICHGTPSPKLLNDYLLSKHIEPTSLKSISFRYKEEVGLMDEHQALSQPGACDNYLLAFLCSLNFTENCYECKYAGINRISDITIGDSWASELPEQEHKRGISLVLCQTQKGEQLLKQSDMMLFPVDLERAVNINNQLREPAKRTNKHDLFFEKYMDKGFNHATFCCLPFKCIKQKIKTVLLKTKVLSCSTNYNISISKNFSKVCENKDENFVS